MFSSKVLLAIVIIVVIIALVLINFQGLGDKLKGAFSGGGKAALGNFGAPGKPSGTIDLSVFPQSEFILKPEAPIDITLESTSFSQFLGEIRVDYLNKTLRFIDSRTPLKVDFKLVNVDLSSKLKLAKLSLQETKMNIIKDGWSKSTNNGTVEIEGFVGLGKITPDYIQLAGNVTRFVEKG